MGSIIIITIWVLILTSCGADYDPPKTPISATTFIDQGVYPESYYTRHPKNMELLRSIDKWSRDISPILFSNPKAAQNSQMKKLVSYIDRSYRYLWYARHRYARFEFIYTKEQVIDALEILYNELAIREAHYNFVMSKYKAKPETLEWFNNYKKTHNCEPYDVNEYERIQRTTDGGEYALSLSFCESDIIRISNSDKFGVFPHLFYPGVTRSKYETTILYDISRRLSLLITQAEEAKYEFDYVQDMTELLTGEREVWYYDNLYVVNEMRPSHIAKYSKELRDKLNRYYRNEIVLDDMLRIYQELELSYISYISYLLLLRSQVTMEVDKRI